MTIRATFQGANGSLGYKTGTVYSLNVQELRGFIVVDRGKGAGRCIYTGLRAFMRNWNDVKMAG